MNYSFPDYYDEFQCIADQCEATCCAGWQTGVRAALCRRFATEFQDTMDEGIARTFANAILLFERIRAF